MNISITASSWRASLGSLPRALLCSFIVLAPLAHGEAGALAGLGSYGPGIGGDSLGNSAIGGPVAPLKYFVRFRAAQSSELVSVTFPFLSSDYPGYGGGTGGKWRLFLYGDDGSPGHFPRGGPLAMCSVPPSTTSSAERVISFPMPFATTAGELYHLVFENIDDAPQVNYFSVNNWVRLSFTEGGQLNPRFSDVDWGNGHYYSGAWHNNSAVCAIMDIAYANGTHQGMCYGEASYSCPPQDECVDEQLVGQINGPTKMIRERFSVSCGDKVVVGVGARLLKVPGTTTDLSISLRDGSDQLIDSVRIPSESIATGPAPTFAYPPSWDDVGQNARWVTAMFDAPVTLHEGETYFLRWSSTGGTYWAWVMRRLTPEYSYSPATAFGDGWSEYTIDGSTWHSLGRVDFQNDLQFHFITPCAGDFDGDLGVDGDDLGILLANWGEACACSCAGDIDGSGVVDGADFGILLGAWGPCP